MTSFDSGKDFISLWKLLEQFIFPRLTQAAALITLLLSSLPHFSDTAIIKC
jgi:hypothetical protein